MNSASNKHDLQSPPRGPPAVLQAACASVSSSYPLNGSSSALSRSRCHLCDFLALFKMLKAS